MSDPHALQGEALRAALRACATEPVHIPGAIQPHGALLSFDAELGRVLQVSANVEGVLGLCSDEALVSTPAALLGPRCIAQIREAALGLSSFHALSVTLSPNGRPKRFRLLPYRSGRRVVVELEPEREPEPAPGEATGWLLSVMTEWQTQLAHFEQSQALFDALTHLVRRLAGYDRVMVYRFDEDWHGSVIAESRTESADSYLGHHFPASDIPEQVRRLYDMNPVRDIPDATVDPVPLLPSQSPEDPQPLDLSRGTLRAAAPIHRAYLESMAVVASMSIALHIEGRLWGLLACHAARPLVLPPAVRDALRVMTCSAAAQLEVLELHRRTSLIDQANRHRDLLLDERGEFSRPSALVERHGQAWLDVFRASGVALITSDETSTVGDVPSSAAIAALVPRLRELPGTPQVRSTRELGSTPLAELDLGHITGLLAAPLPARTSTTDWLLFFRGEKIETRIWAGNPEKTLEKQGARLSPRSSFAAWKDEVRGRSEAWSAVEERAAIDLAGDMGTLVAASEINRLNEQLTELATQDHLTGLWNRYRMEEAIDHELAMAKRYGRGCSLLMFDIDHFKRFNDTFGHQAGDEVLVKVSRVVSAAVRGTDRIGRWGGEEFMVLAVQTDPEGALCLASRLVRAIAGLDLGDYGRVTASFGVASCEPSEDRAQLIARADQALYAAKAAGRNRVEVAAS